MASSARSRRRRRSLVALAVVLAAVAGVLALTVDEDEGPGWLATLTGRSLEGTSAGGDALDRTDGTSGGEAGERGDQGAGPGGTTAADDEPTTEVVTSVDLEPFVLRGSDFPPGFVTVVAPAEEEPATGCLAPGATVPAAETRVVYRKGQAGAVVSNRVADHLDEASAVAALEALRAAAAQCVAARGAADEPTYAAASVPSAADEVVALDLTFRQEQQVARGQLVHARVGRYVTTVLTLSLERADLAIGRDALATVVARLRNGS